MNNLQVERLFHAAALGGAILLGPPGAHAAMDAPNPLTDRHISLYLGGFYPSVSSTIRLDANVLGGIGDEISLEDELGLEKGEPVLWGGLVWQISRRNLLELEYFQLNRSGKEEAISEPYQIGDSLAQVGARLETKFDVDIGRITYGYMFVKKPRLNVAVKGGLHWLKLDAEITLSGAVVDIQTDQVIDANSTRTEGGAVGAPLPHAGFSLSYAITPKVLARGQALLFGASIEEFSGFLLDAGFDFTYMPIKHFGFGGGLRYFDLKLEADIDRLSGEFEFGYLGPTLFLIGNF